MGGKQYCNLRSHTAHATHRQLMSGGITGQQKLHLNDNMRILNVRIIPNMRDKRITKAALK